MSMRYVLAREAGGPEVLSIATGERPQPMARQVLIRVMAAGVNRPDLAQRQGAYPPPEDASPILGLEVAGEVVAVGEQVAQWKIGDRVCALTHGGGYAEYVSVHETHCLPWPKGFDAIRAAALPETYFTVWANVFQLGRLTAGEAFLVHGGSSGIGTTAIQLAKAFGATVYATAGTAAKCEACRQLGADHVIDYRQQDFEAEIKRIGGGRGVDVILDMVGGGYLMKNVRSLAMDGRIVMIATMQGPKMEVDLRQIMKRRASLTGSMLRPRTLAEKGRIAAELREQVWPLLESGRCAPLIEAVFELEQVEQAHRRLEDGAHIGKIMLRVAD